jgi:3-deoxy-D-manno-octulosonate 8-phosphate phosphatase (KDO 8-P phosphatase)
MTIKERAKRIKCILVDVDGTLTDGKIYIDYMGNKSRCFNIKDGLGFSLWKKAGFKFGFITGDESGATKERASMLGADFLYFSCLNKLGAIKEIIENNSYKREELAYIGDDIIDIPALKYVGLAVAVNNAVSELSKVVHFKTKNIGGDAAVREVIEFILKSKGLWNGIIKGISEANKELLNLRKAT